MIGDAAQLLKEQLSNLRLHAVHAYMTGTSVQEKSEDKGIEMVAFKATKSLSWATIPALYLHHELGVSLCTCDNHIHPDPHGLRRGSDHVVDSVMSLYTEGQGGIWALKERRNGDLKSGDPKNKNIFL